MTANNRGSRMPVLFLIVSIWLGWLWSVFFLGPPELSELPRYQDLEVVEGTIDEVAWGKRAWLLFGARRKTIRKGSLLLIVDVGGEKRRFMISDTKDRIVTRADGSKHVVGVGTRSLSNHIGEVVTLRGQREPRLFGSGFFSVWDVMVGEQVFYRYQSRINNAFGKKRSDFAATVQLLWFLFALIASGYALVISLTDKQKRRIELWLGGG